jgi:hypothetical protein
MATNTWGVEDRRKSGGSGDAKNKSRRKKAALTPAAAQAAHKGIVWLHASAIAVWLLVVVTLGALLAAAKPVPPVVVIAGAGAALGHALFLATHLLLARKARQKAVSTRAGAAT